MTYVRFTVDLNRIRRKEGISCVFDYVRWDDIVEFTLFINALDV